MGLLSSASELLVSVSSELKGFGGMGEYSPHHESFRSGVRKGKKWAPDWETGESGGLLGESGQIHLF